MGAAPCCHDIFDHQAPVRLEFVRLMGLHLARLDPECQTWPLISSHIKP